MNCPEPQGGTSCDAFHDGRFHLYQPTGRGFRAGLDAMLLAATVPEATKGRAVDLGAGTGAVGFALARRCPGLGLVLAERDPAVVGLLGRSLALGANAGFAGRIGIAEVDILGPREHREAAGLVEGAFDLVATNPPFHPAGGRLSPDPARNDALAMPEPGFLRRWIGVAAALLGSRGVLAMIARPDNLPEILRAAENRLGEIRIMAVHPRGPRAATRILVHARKGSRAPLGLLAPLVLRDAQNDPLPIERALGRGEAALDLGLL